MAVNVDHVHLSIKYPPKYSVSYIAKHIKGVSSRELRERYPHLREWCPDHLWAPSCFHGSVGQGWEVVEKYISGQKKYKGGIRAVVKEGIDRLRTFVRGCRLGLFIK